jgi:hypothetical protein
MTFEQLEEELPNGLHDAQIRSFARNFENGTLTVDVRIHIGLREGPPEKREEYRNGFITFTGVELFVIESPDASSAFLAPGSVSFSVSQGELDLLSVDIIKKLTQGIDIYSLFILDWYSNIHIAASDMSFGWDA